MTKWETTKILNLQIQQMKAPKQNPNPPVSDTIAKSQDIGNEIVTNLSTLSTFSSLTRASQVASGNEPNCQCRRCKRCGFNPWVSKIPWRRAWQPTSVFLLGEPHGQRSLVGYSKYIGLQSQTQLSD